MNEIKFRAWDTHENKWAIHPYPVGAQFSNTEFGFDDEKGRFVLMQYTGLRDKNGKEIYEGDVVGTDYNSGDGKIRKNTVEFFSGAFGFQGIWLGQLKPENLEVIGNIYENPELLA